jgi:hypothetical protein
METGKVRTGEDTGAGWVDTTAASMERARTRLAELNDLLTEAGTQSLSRMPCSRAHLAALDALLIRPTPGQAP